MAVRTVAGCGRATAATDAAATTGIHSEGARDTQSACAPKQGGSETPAPACRTERLCAQERQPYIHPLMPQGAELERWYQEVLRHLEASPYLEATLTSLGWSATAIAALKVTREGTA